MKDIEKELVLKSTVLHKKIIEENKKLKKFFYNVNVDNNNSKFIMITHIMSYKKSLNEYQKYLGILFNFSKKTRNHAIKLKEDFKKNQKK